MRLGQRREKMPDLTTAVAAYDRAVDDL